MKKLREGANLFCVQADELRVSCSLATGAKVPPLTRMISPVRRIVVSVPGANDVQNWSVKASCSCARDDLVDDVGRQRKVELQNVEAECVRKQSSASASALLIRSNAMPVHDVASWFHRNDESLQSMVERVDGDLAVGAACSRR
jgi:hypothetical protein